MNRYAHGPDPALRRHLWRLAGATLVVLLPMLVHQGCGGAEYISTNPFLSLDRSGSGGPIGDDTSQSIELPLESVQPREVRIGDYLLIHGRGRIFPAGFARVNFSGSGTTEVELVRPVGELRVRVPPGTISGPLGFLISQRAEGFNQGGFSHATGQVTPAFRIPYPGIRVLGAAEPPGGFPNSPYPQGPPVVPIPAPSF